MEEYSKDWIEIKFPFCDYAITPKSAWNFAFAEESVIVENDDGFDRPFSAARPPVQIIAGMVEIDWGYEEGHDAVCARIPHSRKPIGPIRPVVLKPYGCTNLRMTEVPKLE